MKKHTHILVTGGAGFLGNHVVDLLLKNGFTVTLLDRLSKISLSHPFFMHHKKNLHIVQQDLTESPFLSLPYEVDVIMHFAGKNGVKDSYSDPEAYFQANVMGTRTILEFARRTHIRTFFYASSMAVYGESNCVPTDEEVPVKPESPYALTKYLGEQMALHYGAIYGFTTISFRMAGLFGPSGPIRKASASVFTLISEKIAKHEEVSLDGDGSQIRDFVDVRDASRAYMMALSQTKSGIYNLGGGEGISLRDLVVRMGGRYAFSGKPAEPPLRVFASIQKIKRDLGWTPEYNIGT